jgi:uncharacterized protein (UPF0264 family)
VAVAYADWQSAGAPDPHRVLALGAALGCRVLLVDTFSKSRGTLVDHVKLKELEELIGEAHDRGCQSALAGSLGIEQIAPLASLRPDYIAVRGAACAGGRTSIVDVQRVRRLAAEIRRVVV